MSYIIRNHVKYATGSNSSGGSDNIVKLTQAEYDALPESKNSNGILYAITDGECSSSTGGVKPIEITQEEYDALGDSVNTDGILYAITDGEDLTANNLEYDGSETELGNNIQDAIDENARNISELNKKTVIYAEKITVENVVNAANSTTSTNVPFDITGKQIHSLDVYSTGFAGVIPQGIYYHESSRNVVVTCYNVTATQRTANLSVTVRYSLL